jgi:hypothetical protein
MELFHGSPADMTGRSGREVRSYAFLDRLGISFDRTDHPDEPATGMDVCAKVDGCAYFPAFEILNDELRDYRFYAEDMLHPSELARKIILERFLDACFIPRAKADYEAAELRRRQSRHIPLAERGE